MIQRLIFRLFGLDDSPEYSRVRALSVPRQPALPQSGDVDEILQYLRKKHMVTGISIFTDEGTLVATTFPEEDAVHEYSVFEQVAYELADATHFYVQRDGEWVIAFRHNSHVFVIHAPAYLNMVELSAIARDAEKMLFSVGW